MKTMMKQISSKGTRRISYLILLVILGCQSIPKGAKGVSPFNINKYLGKWYEIARIDFKYEKDLNNVTATYSQLGEGYVKVLNQGFNFKENRWEKAEGKARFSDEPNVGELEVSFFWIFYSGYNVIALEGDYQYALIAGKNLDYLWILSRTITIPTEVKESFLRKAKEIGYDTSRLNWIKHNRVMENTNEKIRD